MFGAVIKSPLVPVKAGNQCNAYRNKPPLGPDLRLGFDAKRRTRSEGGAIRIERACCCASASSTIVIQAERSERREPLMVCRALTMGPG